MPKETDSAAIEEPALSQLNAALYRARALDAEARIAAAAAREAARDYNLMRCRLSEALGVSLGETHGWDEATGEIIPLKARNG
ncbi:MAG: hypothetical protein KGL39_49700 [Patescibacteria group bacterium]|nr:hypothetical protein [Patescibacteria group bacterium]